MKILIKNVKSPSCFWGIKDGVASSPRFHALKQEIDDYFGHDQLYKCVLPNPVEGKKCVMQYESHNWQRAVVEAVLVTPYGCRVRCFLVDVLEVVMASSNRLFTSPSWVWEEPTQGIRFSLHGVVPACLWTDYHKDQVEMRSHRYKWESSAVQYLKELVHLGGSQGFVDIIAVDENHVHDVYLFLSFTGSDPVSVADMLINKKFALPLCEASPVDAPEVAVEIVKPDISKQSLEMSTSLDEIIKEVNECLNNSSSSGSSSCHRSPCRKPRVQNVLCSSALGDPSVKSCKDKSLFNLSLSAITESGRNHSSNIWPEGGVQQQVTHVSHQYSNADSNFSPEKIKLSNSFGRGEKLNSLLHEIGEAPGLGSIHDKTRNKLNGTYDHTEMLMDLNSNEVVQKNIQNVTQMATSGIPVELQNKLEKIAGLTKSGTQSNVLFHDKESARENILLMEKLLKEAKDMLNHVEEPVPRTPVDNLLNINKKLTNTNRSSFDIKDKNQVNSTTSVNANRSSVINEDKQQRNGSPQSAVNALHRKKESFFTVQQPVSNSANKHSSMLVKGVKPPNPYPLFCKTPFPSFITNLFEGLKFRGPTHVQAYAWPAIMEKRDLVALAPSGGGKTLAYVAPLVSILCQHRKTAPENVRNPLEPALACNRNPEIIVLCSSWKDVQNVTDCFKSLLHYSESEEQPHRVIGISGGPAVESKRAVELVAGCSVLVASPHSLIRICKAKYLTLDRLEYLVLDNIHILVEEFTTELREIMRVWSESLCDTDRTLQQRYKPKIFGFGVQWTKGVKSFMDAYMSNPLLYINHPLEAAVFGQVHQEIHIWNREKSYHCLVDLLQSTNSERSGGVAVFVKSAATMKKVVAALTCASVYCLGVEGSMMSIEMQEVQKLFDDDVTSAPVLVITDDALKMIAIDNIEISVHFELAKDKYTFGLRLGFMQYYYQIQSEGSKPCSHIFLAEENVSEVIGVVKLLQRLSQPIPPQLELLATKAVQSEQIAKGQKPLCPNLKAYGRCRDAQSCCHRHFVSKHLDAPNADPKFAKVPTQGFIQLKVTCVANATLFYGHVVKTSDTEVQSANQFETISRKLQEHFGYGLRERMLSIPKFGKTFAFCKGERFYRANLERSQNQHYPVAWKSPAGVTKLRIHLVDTGQCCTATLDSLYVLPQLLAAYPYQAIQVQACGVKPIDNDTEWSVQASELVHDKIYDKIVEGNVVLALGHTIWLKPVLIRSNLPITAIRVTDCDVIEELTQSGLSEKNLSHVKNLLEKCKDFVNQNGNDMALHGDLKSGKRLTPNIQTPHVPPSQITTQDNLPQDTTPSPCALPRSKSQSVCNDSKQSVNFNKSSSANDLATAEEEIVSVCSEVNVVLKSDNLVNGEIVKKCSRDELTSSQPNKIDLVETSTTEKSESVFSEDDNSFEIYSTEVSPAPSISSSTEVDLCDIPIEKNSFQIPPLVKSCEDDRHLSTSTLSSSASLSGASSKGSSIQLNQVKSIENKLVNGLQSALSESTVDSGSVNVCAMPSNVKSDTPTIHESPLLELASDCQEGCAPEDLSVVHTVTKYTQQENSQAKMKVVGQATSFSPETRNSLPSPEAISTINLLNLKADNGKTSSNTNQSENVAICCSPKQTTLTRSNVNKSVSSSSQNKALNNEGKSNRAVKLEELKDLDPNKTCGLLHPLCVQLARSQDVALRQQLCQELYMATREMPFDVTERDLKSLKMVLIDARSVDEKVLILGSYLSLAAANVPLSDCLTLKQLVTIAQNMGGSENLIKVVKSLGKMIIQNANKDLPQSVKDLVLHVSDMSSLDIVSEQSFVVALEMLDNALEEDPTLLKDLEELDLAGLLIKVKHSEELECVKRSLFVKIVSYKTEILMKINEEPDQPTTAIKSNEKPPVRKMDCLNYDRFNDIDTDTSSLCSVRPYTPIPVKFDTDTDTESTATETDHDQHFFGI